MVAPPTTYLRNVAVFGLRRERALDRHALGRLSQRPHVIREAGRIRCSHQSISRKTAKEYPAPDAVAFDPGLDKNSIGNRT